MTISPKYILLIIVLTFLAACTPSEKKTTAKNEALEVVEHPEWSVDANIYEVNIRQYTPEGTFNAFREHLPRLQEMGVEILWLMPIHPIGEENRKGTLGSYYAVKDFKAINPNFGTEEDFKALVDDAHNRGMKVIIDWVANHSAWDNVWTESNPEWYTKDEDGNFTPPVADWSDVIQLNYDVPELREAMADAMEYWVRDFNIDGYRCDVAYMVPLDFWTDVHQRLDAIKDVFMLAEAEEPELHQAFDMTYSWSFKDVVVPAARGDKPLSELDSLMMREQQRFPEDAYRMYFTTNHDENSWQGSDIDLYGDNFQNYAVLAATIDGMPLIYSGQESGLDKQLEFFEKDEIDWDDYKYREFYTTLLKLKKDNEALWNGEEGGSFSRIESSEGTYAFSRNKGNNQVIVLLNFNTEESVIRLTGTDKEGYEFINTEGTDITIDTDYAIGDNGVTLPAHSWGILVK